MRLAKLNRSMSHRNAMFRNLVSALIEHEQIKTTFPKAKAISRLAERVITWSKYGLENVFYQRKAESYLMNWIQVRQHLFQNLAKRYENRAGGYTRIHRVGHRTHDHAPLAVIELVDNPRDLKRDKVIRTVSRELAELELKKGSRSTSGSLGQNQIPKVPAVVWRNLPCRSELQAKRAIDDLVQLLPELTRKNLKKVLSEQYVKAYQHCQPVEIPTKDEAKAEISRRRQLRRELLRKAATEPDGTIEKEKDSSATESSSSSLDATTQLTPSFTTPQLKVGNYYHVKGIPRPLGAYTDFLYHVRLHFHRNLVFLDPKRLGSKDMKISAALTNPHFAGSLDHIPSVEENDDVAKQENERGSTDLKPRSRRWRSKSSQSLRTLVSSSSPERTGNRSTSST